MSLADDDVGLAIGWSGKAERLLLKRANRHGLIAGATGTGKTVTLQILSEGFSRAGVPVFLADVKGDLSGMSLGGADKPFLSKRANLIGLEDYGPEEYPVTYWDLFGKKGHPIRTTISEMGPLLLARLLDLNETQEGILNIAFQIADDDGLLLLDLKDLRSLLVFMSENRKEISAEYGNVTTASIGAIQRSLLSLEQQGGKKFFGEPALDLEDFMRVSDDGRGVINILAADKLILTPKLYSSFLLWLLSELFEALPEVGDPEKPKLVFVFDEAHLLFKDAPGALLDKIEQVVRLIRSKGVGVYFVTQSPSDLPESVLGQLGNRVQHALRAYTPKDRKAVRAAAETFRENPKLDTATVITELGVGEALVSTLDAKGRPSVVQQTLIRPPCSRLGPAKPAERRAILAESDLSGRYDEAVDRKSAYEILTERGEKAAAAEERRREEEERAKEERRRKRSSSSRSSGSRSRGRSTRRRSSRRQGIGEALVKSAVRTIGSQLGRQLVRGLLGSLLK